MKDIDGLFKKAARHEAPDRLWAQVLERIEKTPRQNPGIGWRLVEFLRPLFRPRLARLAWPAAAAMAALVIALRLTSVPAPGPVDPATAAAVNEIMAEVFNGEASVLASAPDFGEDPGASLDEFIETQLEDIYGINGGVTNA
ncbi:MAG: hypothetical protein HZB29_12125 [Nitrospinae bacterium]|nr:hypothetical protein [Nitrospinota bacterium]